MTKGKKGGNLRGSQPRNTQKGQRQMMAGGRGGGNDTVRYAPVAVATRRTGAAPNVQTRNGITTISHRSFLAPISNEASYTVDSFAVNPGLSQTFPWLHRVARRYEEYRFRKLRFEYRSVAATSTAGVIMLSFDYDAADVAPTSKQAQAQTIPNAESNAWTNIDLVVPTGTIPWKYVRAGILASNLDVKTYDAGQFLISSLYGNGVVSGELYVEYEVELRKPTEGPIGGCVLTFAPTAITTPFSAPVPGLTFGVSPVSVAVNFLEFVSSGEWLITFFYTGTSVTANFPSPTFTGMGASKVPTGASTAFTTTSATRSLAVRSLPGDRLTIASLASGTPTNFIVTIALIDYDSVY